MRDMIALRSTRSAAPAAALAFAGLIALLGVAAPSPARAQVSYEAEQVDAVLAPRAVLARLGREGYRGFTHPRFDGDTYTLDADSPWGNRVRLTVDARSGRVLDRDRIEAPLYPPGIVPGARRPGYGWTEAEARIAPPGDLGRPLPRDPEVVPLPRIPSYGRGGPLPEEPRLAARPLPQPERSLPQAARPAPTPSAARDANPLGLNPDNPAIRRPAAPRRTAKPAPKPVESPAALVEPRPALKRDAAPEPAKPAVAANAPAADPGWKTPPDSGNRPVRVIGGITQVPAKDEAGKAAP
ncbi:putative exported protein of unknown function [Methylobacterium sp. 4-46]|nr:putative exported protein of unknown function [Methylobacterium sp. 4-46]